MDKRIHKCSGCEKLEAALKACSENHWKEHEKHAKEIRELVEAESRVTIRNLEAQLSQRTGLVREMVRTLAAAREMLGVFEDNGGHDGLGGKGYLACLDQIDMAKAEAERVLGEPKAL